MNLKVRVKNPVFWVQIVLSILTAQSLINGDRSCIFSPLLRTLFSVILRDISVFIIGDILELLPCRAP